MKRKQIIAAMFAFFIMLWLGGNVAASTDVYLAVLVGMVPVLPCLWIILRSEATDRRFLVGVFLAALAVRYVLAFIIYSQHLQQYLGGDADTYDAFGYALRQSWRGLVDPNAFWLVRYTSTSTSGWGMYYFVAGTYYLIGQNPLAIQLINCALGAAGCIAAHKIAMRVYPGERVARAVALMTAFSPSLILWTSQGLKDGPIVLFVSLCILYALKLREKLGVTSFGCLLVSLACLYTLRHYMFYIMFAAVAGGLLFATRRKFSPLQALQGAALVVIIGLAFGYFGAGEVAKNTLDLNRVQRSREYNATAANSGFGGDVDITDPKAAIEFLPIGVLYVLLAPFPWMITNLRQLITLPELIAWWCLMPMMLKGYWYVVRNRLRESFAVCTFVVGVTLAFALYQSNAGTAYRHRSQVYVFFFVFMCIGLELRRNAKLSNRRRTQFVPLGRLASTAMTGRLAGPAATLQTERYEIRPLLQQFPYTERSRAVAPSQSAHNG